MSYSDPQSENGKPVDSGEPARHARELAVLTHDPRLRAVLLRIADEMEADQHDTGVPRR